MLLSNDCLQSWRTSALIGWGLSGKTIGLDKLCLSRPQILWGMFYQKNVDYVEINIGKTFIYQLKIESTKSKKNVLPSVSLKLSFATSLFKEKLLPEKQILGFTPPKDD
ncbi:hypothetical protein Tco_0315882 [Tanacetum coccineum]